MSEAAIQTPPTRERAAAFLTELQQTICDAFEELDGGGKFEIDNWTKKPEDMLQGSGSMRVMRGNVFEKVGVNFSHVYGTFSDKFRKEIPGAEESGGAFWACGVSLVAHMKNPHVPITHMNVRRIETSKGWFGGGADLTPILPYEEDTALFHTKMKEATDPHGEESYEKFKKWADEYYFLPHRNEPRGVGGTFFDYIDTGDFEKDFALIQNTGHKFLEAYTEIVRRRKDTPWTPEEKEKQLIKRGRYVEFNLLHDRGTRFGFQTGGNTEAILMSMPPEVKWP